MLINLRNALMAGKRLPYDAEVEFLESTGTQWFDTGFKASGGCVVEYKFIQGITSDRGYLFGSHNPPNNSTNDWNRNQSGILNETLLAFNKCGKLTNIRMGNINTANFHVIKFDTRQTLLRGWFDASLVVDDITTGVLDPVSNIVGFYAPYYQNIAKGSLAWAKIWDVNEFLVRDLVPVRFTNEQGQSEGAMYDRANPTVGMNPDGSPRTDGLYRNRGTGAFSWGADKTA